MSYRAFKHLLGETSLERKCRFLFGAFTLLLIASSFAFYAWRTELLAYDQLISTSQLLVDPVVKEQIALSCDSKNDTEEEARHRRVQQFHRRWERAGITPPKGYGRRFIRPDATDPERQPETPTEHQLLREFKEDPTKIETDQLLFSQDQEKSLYYAA